MKQRHFFIGLAVLGTAAPLAIGALVTGNAMATDGASDAFAASISIIVPDPDGEGVMQCTSDFDLSGAAALAGDAGEGSPIYSISVSALQTDSTATFDYTITMSDETQTNEVPLHATSVIVAGDATAPDEGDGAPLGTAVDAISLDVADVRQGTPEECATVAQPLVQVSETP